MFILIKYNLLVFYLFLVSRFFFINESGATDLSVNQTLLEAQEKAKTLSSPAIATLWGGYRRFKIFNNNQGRLIKLNTPLFKTGEIEVYLRKTTSRELVVFMPGIFGSIQKGLTPQMIDQIEQTNVNLLVLPNMLSQEHIQAQPEYNHDPIMTEVKIHEAALDLSLQQLGYQNIKVHVIAESLGSIIGSAWASYDLDNKKRLSSLMLLWPPLDLYLAMKNFDHIVDEHRKNLEDCNFIKRAWLLLTEMALKDYPAALSNKDSYCLGSVVLLDGFVEKSKKSWLSYTKASGIKGATPKSFEDFFRNYRSEIWNLIEKKDEVTRLETWIKKIKKTEDFPLTILTGRNDFLNSGVDLEKFKINSNLNDSQLVIFPWGGHSGPIGMDKFYKIIQFFSPAI